MTFFSLAEINAQITILLQQYNNYLFSQLKTTRRQQFLEIEKETLSPLPAQRYELRNYKALTVQSMGYIYLSDDKHYYSVPHKYIGRKVEVQYTTRSVEAFYGNERIALHARDYSPGRYTSIAEHLSSSHQFVAKWSPEFFRQWARKYGLEVEHYVTGLINQADYPETAYKQCLGLLSLAKEYGSYRLRKACSRARQYPRFGYRIVKDVLKNNMDTEPDLFSAESPIPEHDNIRGANYYE